MPSFSEYSSTARTAPWNGVLHESQNAMDRALSLCEECCSIHACGSCAVSYLVRNNPTHQYILRATQLENSLAEKDLRGLVDITLN